MRQDAIKETLNLIEFKLNPDNMWTPPDPVLENIVYFYESALLGHDKESYVVHRYDVDPEEPIQVAVVREFTNEVEDILRRVNNDTIKHTIYIEQGIACQFTTHCLPPEWAVNEAVEKLEELAPLNEKLCMLRERALNKRLDSMDRVESAKAYFNAREEIKLRYPNLMFYNNYQDKLVKMVAEEQPGLGLVNRGQALWPALQDLEQARVMLGGNRLVGYDHEEPRPFPPEPVPQREPALEARRGGMVEWRRLVPMGNGVVGVE